MKQTTNAHRASFSVRCACGNEFHTDATHIGRKVRCPQCGRILTIEAPVDTAPDTTSSSGPRAAQRSKPDEPLKRRRRKKRVASSPTHGMSRWRTTRMHRVLSTIEHYALLHAHDLVHPRAMRRWVTRLSWFAFVLAALGWFMLAFLSERFVPATLLAYGPRAVLLVPIVLMLPFALIWARRASLPLLLATWIVFVPVMGARFSPFTLGRTFPPTPPPGTMRVLTFNALNGHLLAPVLPEMVREYAPDLMAFQECGLVLWKAIEELPGWYTQKTSSLCTASRWPIVRTDSMSTPHAERISRTLVGGYGNLARHLIRTPTGVIAFVNLHLPTARYGLESLLSGDGFIPENPIDAVEEVARGAGAALGRDPTGRLQSNTTSRALAAERASALAIGDGSLPTIVVGDFNMPVESTIYRERWSNFTNAFEKRGNGLGWTKREGLLLRIRIDHVLMTDDFKPREIMVGRDHFSDHLPVIADLVRN